MKRIIVDCMTGEVQEVDLTPEEIAQKELDRIEFEKELAAQEAEAARITELKESAKAKLVAGEPLTEEEAATLVI